MNAPVEHAHAHVHAHAHICELPLELLEAIFRLVPVKYALVARQCCKAFRDAVDSGHMSIIRGRRPWDAVRNLGDESVWFAHLVFVKASEECFRVLPDDYWAWNYRLVEFAARHGTPRDVCRAMERWERDKGGDWRSASPPVPAFPPCPEKMAQGYTQCCGSPLHLVLSGDPDDYPPDQLALVKTFLAAGFHPFGRCSSGATPFYHACNCGWIDAQVAHVLLDAPCSDEERRVGCMAGPGVAPIHSLSGVSRRAVVSKTCSLIERIVSIEPEAVNRTVFGDSWSCNFGETPLHIAVYNDAKDVLRTLVRLGANVNARDFGGRTPLHNFGVRLDDPELDPPISTVRAIYNIMVESGADLHLRDNDGKTVREAMMENGWQDVLDN